MHRVRAIARVFADSAVPLQLSATYSQASALGIAVGAVQFVAIGVAMQARRYHIGKRSRFADMLDIGARKCKRIT